MDSHTNTGQQQESLSDTKLPLPSELIATAVATLKIIENTDAMLLGILSDTILTLTPSNTAVGEALKAIEDLAVQRAEEPNNGQDKH